VITSLIIAIVLGALAAAQPASAQVGVTDAFMPRSWQPGASVEREAARPRSGRRGGQITTTTQLDEFDVPRRSASRSSRARSVSRVVERKRAPKRVKVAALGRSDAVSTVQRRAVPKKARATQVAALGPVAPTVRAPSSSLTGGGIAWRASSSCLASNLRSIVASLASSYGAVTVNSTCRSARHNRRVGGARKSWHLTGNAVDFRIRGANIRGVYAFLRSSVGGLKHYGGGRFHIDNGPKRTF
jgi:hypothetical protein